MKIQELVYNRPNLIRSQVGSVSTFGCMLQFRIFFSLSNLCVYSVQCRQKVKLNNANVHSGIIVSITKEKESAIIMCVQFSVGLCQWIHIILCAYIYMYVLVCACVRQGVHICVTVSMCRR